MTAIQTSDMKSATKAWRLIVTGYSLATMDLVAFLTINGAFSIPTPATIGIAGLALIGLLLPAVGILQLRRNLGPINSAARHGFALQTFGLLCLLFGLVPIVIGSSLLGNLFSACFVVLAGVLAIAGAVLLRKHFISANSSLTNGAMYLIFGTVLIFSGVGLIVASNIATEYIISQVTNTIYVDVGTMVSAWGCVLAAYSFFNLYNRS